MSHEEEDTYMSHEEEDTYMSHEEEDTYMSHEEEDTYMSHEEEDTYMSHEEEGTYMSHEEEDTYLRVRHPLGDFCRRTNVEGGGKSRTAAKPTAIHPQPRRAGSWHVAVMYPWLRDIGRQRLCKLMRMRIHACDMKRRKHTCGTSADKDPVSV